MATQTTASPRRFYIGVILLVLVAGMGSLIGWRSSARQAPTPTNSTRPIYDPRSQNDTSGLGMVVPLIPKWPANSSLESIASYWRGAGHRLLIDLDAYRDKRSESLTPDLQRQYFLQKAGLLNFEGEPEKAYAVLAEARTLAENNADLTRKWLYTIIFLQGVTALRWGETDNCVLCRGESSCILPINSAAIHTKPTGSRHAIEHFTEYLDQFPDDLEVQWLLNIAHMTLGEHPDRVDPRHLISLDRYNRTDYGIGKFREIGHLVGINRLNLAGGAIMDDFDNDGLLDLVFTSMDPTQPMVFYRNKGDGTFEDRTEAAGLLPQLGGINCIQADYNNDGFLDIFICRGAWIQSPIRPSLLRNNGNGTFTDVTAEAGLLDPVNSISAAWADYDNDGFLDLFICCERQPNRLYRNRGDGTFEEVAVRAGVAGNMTCKGATWIDFDNDGYPDLFVNNLNGRATLYRNNGNGTFTDVTLQMGIDGPQYGFGCWAFDYNNDGWPDIFAITNDYTVADVVKGLLSKPHGCFSNKLYRNIEGKRFQDVTKEAGLDLAFAAMGCNFGDFDNDGFLDFYLGTGDPQFSTLVPNRMFRNLGGKQFAEITGSSGTGHLQKGHGVACGDWRRNGMIDIAIEMGGPVNGDRYHNLLFQNPGHENNWLNVKLVGKKTNRSAIGARIKVVTAGEKPLTVYRWVSSGSSFGANPLEQEIGLGKANRVAVMEVYWPTSGTTQTFRDLSINQFIEVTEFASECRKREFKPISIPKP
jgi:hypothetical protein